MEFLGCCDDGADLCLFVSCCQCLAIKETAENIGQDGTPLCCLSLCCFHSCAAASLGSDLANKRGIKKREDGCINCLYAYCDVYTCFTCRLLAESRDMKKEEGGSAPATQDMKR